MTTDERIEYAENLIQNNAVNNADYLLDVTFKDEDGILVAYKEEGGKEIGRLFNDGVIEMADNHISFNYTMSEEDAITKFVELAADNQYKEEQTKIIDSAYSFIKAVNADEVKDLNKDKFSNIVFDKKDDILIASVATKDGNEEIGRADIANGTIEMANGSGYTSPDSPSMDTIARFAEMIVESCKNENKKEKVHNDNIEK